MKTDRRLDVKKKEVGPPEEKTSHTMWLQFNPVRNMSYQNYVLDDQEYKASMNTTTMGKVGKSKEFEPDPLDQVYFRKKDEISRYTEVFVKQKVGAEMKHRLFSEIDSFENSDFKLHFSYNSLFQ